MSAAAGWHARRVEHEEAEGRPLEIPSELRGGVYANSLFVWYTEHEFTLDFATPQYNPPDAEEEGPLLVVSRIRMPVTAIFDVLRSVNAEMTGYERRFGEIARRSEDA